MVFSHHSTHTHTHLHFFFCFEMRVDVCGSLWGPEEHQSLSQLESFHTKNYAAGRKCFLLTKTSKGSSSCHQAFVPLIWAKGVNQWVFFSPFPSKFQRNKESSMKPPPEQELSYIATQTCSPHPNLSSFVQMQRRGKREHRFQLPNELNILKEKAMLQIFLEIRKSSQNRNVSWEMFEYTIIFKHLNHHFSLRALSF